MSKEDELAGNPGADPPPVLAPTLRVLNQLEQEGVIEKPVIGGSIALVFYAQPVKTEDLDIFCLLRQNTLIISLAPIYQRLKEMGYESDELYVNIEGVDVQFLIPDDQLTKEGFQSAANIQVEGVDARIFPYEYALAIKAQANRAKDWSHINAALESASPDMGKLRDILQRYNLQERWERRTASD